MVDEDTNQRTHDGSQVLTIHCQIVMPRSRSWSKQEGLGEQRLPREVSLSSLVAYEVLASVEETSGRLLQMIALPCLFKAK